jgi:SNF2 family DNA or RNA helicase
LTPNWQTTTTLFDHQRRAVEKLRRARVGGAFMEMGTGKSRCAIELAWLRRERIDRVVWFCPVSLKETIRYEIEKHAQGAAVYVFDDRTSPRQLPEALFYVVGIESMSTSDRVTLAVKALITERTMVIVDESSYIKGHAARRTQRITLLAEPARYRLLLTGTPISQGVEDLFAQMKFLSPKILGYRSFHAFAANHLQYSDKYPGQVVRALHTEQLAARLAPYTYQVTKAECLDLPDKLHESRYYRMTAEQDAAYDGVKDEILSALDEPDEFNEYVIFRLFSALQQVVCGFRNRRDPETGRMACIPLKHERIDLLLAVLRDVPPGEKVIIWAKYHACIREIVGWLQAVYGEASTAEFHGRLSERQRNAELARWRDSARFLVATQAAGGHGLTLNEASTVIFYADEFKYATRIQAEDRCHRIGQTRPVTYVTLTCVDSIDERIARALARKANAADEFRREVARVKDDRELVKGMVKAL